MVKKSLECVIEMIKIFNLYIGSCLFFYLLFVSTNLLGVRGRDKLVRGYREKIQDGRKIIAEVTVNFSHKFLRALRRD